MTMVDKPQPRFFFIHIMKTGGATFRQHVYGNFAPGEVYPDKKLDPDMHTANYDIAYLLQLPPERLSGIRAFTGHFPFVVTEMLPCTTVTLAVLRDPVARTISYLKHCKRYHQQHRDLSLEEIYDDEFFFRSFIDNHQSKIFGLTIEDQPKSYMDWTEIDDRRLAIAKSNVEKVDLLGVNEHYRDFVQDMRDRFGWKFDDKPNRRVGDESWEADAALRRRIAQDNAADVELYEWARAVQQQRRRARL